MKDKLREMYENGLRGIEPSISAGGLLKAVANGWITTEDAVKSSAVTMLWKRCVQRNFWRFPRLAMRSS